VSEEAVLTEEALVRWGEAIGREAATPLVLALRGDLGAGKSTLARAVARGAGVEGDIPSPTFNLVFRYRTPSGSVSHLDLYRLEDSQEVWELGWEELGEPGERVLIEWPERAAELLPAPRWEVELVEEVDPAARAVRITPVGSPPVLPPLPGGEG
jgi:tRNA threonylcarbamoyladenosine biosynthesis protein TsaE